MFNVGGPEVLVILLVALIVLGPQQLPKAVRSVGNVMAELRRMSSGFQDEIRSALDVPIEVDAREKGSELARRPEDADISETVARNPREAFDGTDGTAWGDPEGEAEHQAASARGRADRRGRGPSGPLAEGEQEWTSTASLPISAPSGDEDSRGGRLSAQPGSGASAMTSPPSLGMDPDGAHDAQDDWVPSDRASG